MLSKPSKGRYLELKRASFASQKVVNWKPIYAPFVCCLRILFIKPLVLTKAIENLKGRSMRKSIVLLLLCLSFLQLTSNSLTCLPSNRSSALHSCTQMYRHDSTLQQATWLLIIASRSHISIYVTY